jgi:hypothetical protein
MANVTPTVAQYFIPEIWANRALEILRANIVMAKSVLRDTDIAAFNQGDTLNVPVPGTFVAKNKAAGSGVTLQTPTDATVPVVIDKHKEVSFLVEDIVRAQQGGVDVMDTYMRSGVVALAEAIETDLFGLWLDATTALGTLGTAIEATAIRSVRKQLNKQKCPAGERYLVLSPDDEVSVMGDDELTAFFANARPEAVAQGSMGTLYGLETYMSQYVPLGLRINLGGATGGTFTVTFGGQTTSGQAYNVTAANLKSAIEGLSTVGAGNVEVTATTTGFEIYPKGTLAGNHDGWTCSVANLTGATNPASADVHYNPAFNREACVLAMRALPSPDVNTGAQAVTLRDPESGLVVRVLYAYNATYLGHQVTIDVLYGVKTLRAAKMTVIKS